MQQFSKRIAETETDREGEREQEKRREEGGAIFLHSIDYRL